MTTLSELVHEGKRRRVTFVNKKGKPILELSLIWTVIIAVAAPQVALLVLILALLEVLDVSLSEQEAGPNKGEGLKPG